MIQKIIRALSAVAVLVLVSGVWLSFDAGTASATGTNVIAVMSAGSDAVQNTIRAEQIATAFAVIIVLYAGYQLVERHGAAGLLGIVLFAVAIGLVVNSREAIDAMGITAATL